MVLKQIGRVRVLLIAAGVIAVAVAAVVPDVYYVRLLTSGSGMDLSWGPSLFRVMLAVHGVLIALAAFFLPGEERASLERPFDDARSESLDGLLTPLAVITVAAVILRVINLDSDLWVDEVLTLVDFVRLPFGQIVASFPSQNQHMLYSLAAGISVAVFGESNWVLRLPALVFGIGSIWAVVLLGVRLLGKRPALFAGALMTVSYHHVWFSQNARGYTGLLLFSLLAMWFWLEALENGGLLRWSAYVTAVVLGMWTHVTMAFVVASMATVHILFLVFPRLGCRNSERESLEGRAGIRPFIAWFVSVTITLQLYAFALPEFLETALHEESRNSEWTNPIWALIDTLNSLSIGYVGVAVVVAAASVAMFGWVGLFKKDQRMGFLLALPILYAGSFMIAAGHNLFPRFFFFAMGYGLIIAVSGVIGLSAMLSRRLFGGRYESMAGIAANVALGLAVAVSLLTVPRNYLMPKQDFRGAREYVEQARSADDIVVAVRIAGEIYGRYYAPSWSVARTPEDLRALEAKNRRIWLIYTLSPEIKAFQPRMWQIITSDYRVIKSFSGSLNGGEIVICRSKNTRGEAGENVR